MPQRDRTRSFTAKRRACTIRSARRAKLETFAILIGEPVGLAAQR